ncbi:phosphoglucosamine mutase [bacterium]|nr:phosphoglucosamine mutase [bacterium]
MKFGTDGIRGVAGKDLTPDIALRLGFAAAKALVENDSERQNSTFIIGKDPRLSSDMLESALASGIVLSGANVVRTGVIPTPAVPFNLKKGDFAGGFMITASHNPIEDNGIKVFASDGLKISAKEERAIEAGLKRRQADLDGISPRFGRSTRDVRLRNKYAAFLKRMLNTCKKNSRSKRHEKDIKLIFDCAYGATSDLCRSVFSGFNANVQFVNAEFDGAMINHKCGATDLSRISEEVKLNGADIGFAFDGDGDRVLIVDSIGNEIDGDRIMGSLALNSAKYYKSGGIVATVMSNLGLEEFLAKNDLVLHRVQVGDKNVMDGLLKHGLLLGGEQSGHIVMLDKSNAGDGLQTAVAVVEMLLSTGKSIAELSADIPRYPQYLVNVRVSRKVGWDKDKAVKNGISRINARYGKSSRLLIRPSGTEPVIRVMAESRNKRTARRLVEEASKVIELWDSRNCG